MFVNSCRRTRRKWRSTSAAGRTLAILLILLALTAPVPTAGADGDLKSREPEPIWLAVVPPALAPALAPLAEHRRAEGLEVVVSTQTPGQALAALERRPACLLLVGDVQAGREDQPWHQPTRLRDLYRWRPSQEPRFASDAAWGDLDGDEVPDIPVGRIPARTAEQLAAAVRKIIAYEQRRPTVEDVELVSWVGAPGYGGALDRVATSLALGSLGQHAPRWLGAWVISGDAGHALCGWPADQPELFCRRLRQGGVLAVLMGHGTLDTFHSMQHGPFAIGLHADQAGERLSGGPPAPPIVFFACGSGDFSAATNSFCEAMLWAAGGPVAAVGATTESHPLPNYFAGISLLKELDGPVRRLGTLWLRAQRAALVARNPLMENTLAYAEGSLEEPINVERLRRDAILMYALLGDPATRLKLPKPLKVSIAPEANGWRWRVENQDQEPLAVARLHVALRPYPPAFPAMPQPLRPTPARRAFLAANVALNFTPLQERGPDEPWEGTVSRPGILRLVAVGGDDLYAAAVVLAGPDAPSAAAIQGSATGAP